MAVKQNVIYNFVDKATKCKNNLITDQNQKPQPTLKCGKGYIRDDVIVLMHDMVT